jgi:hypothetical protein
MRFINNTSSMSSTLLDLHRAQSERVASLYNYTQANNKRHERAANEMRAQLAQCDALFEMAADPNLPSSL